MKTKPATSTPSPPKDERLKTLEQLIAEQGVAKTATFEHLLGAGADLWKDEADFEMFFKRLDESRKQKD